MELRPISIQSRYQNIECGECGATVTIDLDDMLTPDPYAHEDDCTLAHTADPR